MTPSIEEQITAMTEPWSFQATEGFSDESRSITSQAIYSEMQYSSAVSIRPKSDALRYELHESLREFINETGNDIKIIKRAMSSTEIALKILKIFPESISAPEISYDDDGDISFDWIQSKKKMLSVCITPDGNLYYSLLNGQSRARGKEYFDATFPVSIHTHLERLFADQTQKRRFQ